MNKSINLIFNLLLLITVASCSEDGEPGPQGEQGVQGPQGEAGKDASHFVELGTINVAFDGTLLNGQPLNGSKTFTTSVEKNGFRAIGDYHTLSLNGSDSLDYIYFDLNVFNRDNNPTAMLHNLSMNYTEIISESEITTFRFNSIKSEEEVEYRMARNDDTYGFINGAVRVEYYEYDASTGINYQYFELEYGSKVKFQDPYTNYNSTDGYYYGSFVMQIETDGTEITSGTIYDDLELRNSPFDSFYKDGNQLGELVTVLPDELSVTNFVYNETDGIVSFDFEATIFGGRWSSYTNTTRNDMNITGSVEMEVYHQVNARKEN
ncbi:MAG: hypothetical protein ABJH05_12165 [Fulvivirga sp.]